MEFVDSLRHFNAEGPRAKAAEQAIATSTAIFVEDQWAEDFLAILAHGHTRFHEEVVGFEGGQILRLTLDLALTVSES